MFVGEVKFGIDFQKDRLISASEVQEAREKLANGKTETKERIAEKREAATTLV